MKSKSKKNKKQKFSSVKALLKADREKEIAVWQAGLYAAVDGA